MASSESPTLIEEYSQTFTSLQAGKRELIGWGAEAVVLNRFIIDAAGKTGEADTKSVLQSIDINQVPHGDSEVARTEYCDTALKKLISLHEEVLVLQKSAREKGISGGLLTIIGQAANQSPADNGASVLQQLSQLVGNDPDSAPDNAPDSAVQTSNITATDISVTETSPDESAANDIDQPDPELTTGLRSVADTVREQWKPLVIDVSVCTIAACIAISLIN